jgi:ferredoxin
MKLKTSDMEYKSIEKSQIHKFLQTLTEKYKITLPLKKDNLILFQETDSIDKLTLDFVNSKNAPKAFFFPQSEVLLQFEGPLVARKVVEREEKIEPWILFGVRACDIRSFLILDKLFINEDYVDDYYKRRRDTGIIFGYGCNNPGITCFCSSFEIDPFSTQGADLFFTDIGDKFLVEIISSKGKEIAQNLSPATQSEIDKQNEIKEKANSKIKSKIHIEGISEKLNNLFENPIWEEISEKCLGCAVCTYLCPTCHCFDIQDETIDNKGERVRNWDSCMFPIFTLHGSGHQPRDKKFQRIRQRIMHKFNYYMENFNELACVGCGRCVLNCPVNMDIREIISRINKCK